MACTEIAYIYMVYINTVCIDMNTAMFDNRLYLINTIDYININVIMLVVGYTILI